MSGTEVAAVIAALMTGLAAIITAIASLRSANANAAKMTDLEKQNERLKKENEDERNHSDYQDEIILEQHRKIDRWQAWGQRIGRRMNQMELQIGGGEQKNDTQPIATQPYKDWITGPLGPIDKKDVE